MGSNRDKNKVVMISKADKILFSCIAVLLILIFVFRKDVTFLLGSKTDVEKTKKEKKGKGNDKKNSDEKSTSSISEVVILQKWELPPVLKEVSGIAYMDEQRFACIQDEEGTIFIFNRASKQIEKQIPFAGPGDYEGITLNGNTAYIVRADGQLYEVDMNAGESSAKQYSTPLTAEHNIEGLWYDKKNERLLLAAKDDNEDNDYKGVYAFDLKTKKLASDPAMKIDLNNELIQSSKGKKKKALMPSAIGIHPLTNEIFITDGPKARLLILDDAGTSKKFLQLGKEFAQPEGITFSPQGEIFISNEGTKEPGNIIQVKVE